MLLVTLLATMTAHTYVVQFDGGTVRRGFWLYIWEVTAPDGSQLHYVGRTGDVSSANAQSPFKRMGQHLGDLSNQNMLKTHLGKREIEPETCTYRMVAHGPILDETDDWPEHQRRRDLIAALEDALEKAMAAAGYDVLNVVNSKKPLDDDLFAEVKAAFAAEFPALGES